MASPQYGTAHEAERARWKPTVAAGLATCTEPICLEQRDGRTRHIPAGAPWDLAHDRTTGGYHGPAHQRCNRAEGGRWRHAKRRVTADTAPALAASTTANRWRL